MRHATEQDLDALEPLLQELRTLSALKERKRGIFYWRSRAFLHFHEHQGMLRADVRLKGPDFERWALDSAATQQRLLAAIRRRVAAPGMS